MNTGMLVTSKNIEQIVGTKFPPRAARLIRLVGVYSRYIMATRACRLGFREYGSQYSQHTLFIAGLPKSGTSWFSAMLASYPGYHELLIPEQTIYDLATGGAHDFELPDDMFDRFKNMLVVTKMHIYGSPHNAALLKRAKVKYIVLHRDLRDVAVSEVHYVRRMRWHPEYKYYAGKSVQEGLAVFAERTLRSYVQWVQLWHENLDSELGLELRYEKILKDPKAVMAQVARHFGLDSSPERIQQIVARFQFQKLSDGRDQGQGSNNSFFRKGVAGDWQNYFSPELNNKFKKIAGDGCSSFEVNKGELKPH